MICAECGGFNGQHANDCPQHVAMLHQIALGALFAEWDYDPEMPQFVKDAINVHGEALGV